MSASVESDIETTLRVDLNAATRTVGRVSFASALEEGGQGPPYPAWRLRLASSRLRIISSEHRFAVATSPSESRAQVARSEVALLPRDLIIGDESIIFAIKPSLWFIVFDSSSWTAFTLFVVVLSSLISNVLPGVSEAQLVSVVVGLLGARVVAAVLRWVSRFYVLTNRRVMRIRGVVKADVFECPLLNIRHTAVVTGFLESFPRLGTIQFAIEDPADLITDWTNVADPHEVHAEIRRAIRRAHDCRPHI